MTSALLSSILVRTLCAWNRNLFSLAQLWLLAELARLERLEHLAEKFRQKCALHAQWCVPRASALTASDWRTFKLHELKVCVRSYTYTYTYTYTYMYKTCTCARRSRATSSLLF